MFGSYGKAITIVKEVCNLHKASANVTHSTVAAAIEAHLVAKLTLAEAGEMSEMEKDLAIKPATEPDGMEDPKPLRVDAAEGMQHCLEPIEKPPVHDDSRFETEHRLERLANMKSDLFVNRGY